MGASFSNFGWQAQVKGPVNSGYAKTRQHLREKLKREKTQPGVPNPPVTKKVPAELVTTNTVPLPTEDVDELVSMIEGTHIQKSRKGAGKPSDPGTNTKTAKQEKKERQREKKRLEEEAQKNAEEERLRQLEAERVRVEQEARAEELRKKREKKKKRKQKKKNEGKEEAGELMVTIEGTGDSMPIKLVPVMPVEIDQPVPSKSSEMVTIRRHASAPDTTVTISVKSETGDEDLLYTLVNGQVYNAMRVNGSAKAVTAKGPTPTSHETKGKGKKKKPQYIPTPDVTISTEVSEEEEVDPMPPPGAGLYDIDSNMIVMNPDRDEADEDSYNSDDYFFHGRQRAGEFETVLSNKEKRKRIKANKVDEGEGNGSSERPRSRGTPGANGNSSTGRRAKRGSDSVPKNSANSTSDKRDVRRGSGSAKRNGTGPPKGKGEGYKDGSNRKCRKDQRTPAQQGGQEPGTSKARRYGKSDPVPQSQPRTDASPVFPQSHSPGFGEVPPPLPKITPMNTVKMADVVSGNHNRPNRDTPEIHVQVARAHDNIPPPRKAYSSQSFLPTFNNTITVGELDISHTPPTLPKGLNVDKGQHLPESSGTNSSFNTPSVGGNYDMWRSNLAAKESSPEPDFHAGGHSKLQPGNSSNSSVDPAVHKPGIWSWGVDDDPLVFPQAAIRRPPPQHLGATPVFRPTSPLGLNFGLVPVDPNQTNLNFQFNSDSHSHPQPPQSSSHPFVTTRQAQLRSPLQFLSRPQVNSSPSFNRRPPRTVGQNMNSYENFYSMHGEGRLPTPDKLEGSNGSQDYFGSKQPGIQLPQMSNPGGASQTFRRPVTTAPCPPNVGLPFGFSTQRNESNVGQPMGSTGGGAFPPDPTTPSYLFCPIPANKSQESLDRSGSGSQYTLF